MVERLYIECECSSLEHTMRLNWDNESSEEDAVWFDIYLNQYRPWYKRIWPAIQYVFGHKSKFGDFDVTCIEKVQAQEIVKFLKTAFPDDKVA